MELKDTHPPKVITRRNFLKTAIIGLGVGIGIYSLDSFLNFAPKISTEPLSYLLRNEKDVDIFLRVASEFFQRKAIVDAKHNFNVQLNRNPEIKSCSKLIEAGINLYGKPVKFSRNFVLETDQSYFSVMDSAFNKLTIGDLYGYFSGSSEAEKKIAQTESDVTADLFKDHPIATAIMNFAGSQMNSFYEVACVPGSGFFKVLQRIDSEAANQILSGELPEKKHFKEVEAAVLEIIAPFETKYILQSKPGEKYSWSSILADFLRLNNGDLSASLFDTAILAKMFARNDLQTGKHLSNTPGSQGIDKLCYRFTNIKDEYSFVGKNFGLDEAQQLKMGNDSRNKDFSVINRIGGMYHEWYIYALLSKLPRLAIKHLTTMTQLREIVSQGNIKIAIDFNALSDLQSLDSKIGIL